jgi:PAS domain S-box-containing protein
MTAPDSPDGVDQRILIFAPTGRDGELAARFLREGGLRAQVCAQVEELCQEMLDGAGLVFLTGEVLTPEAMRCLVEALAEQPAWSDIPIVVLTSGGGESPGNAEALSALGEAGNVTLIERPVRVMTLTSTIRSGLRARTHQYQVRDYLSAEREAKEALEESEQRLLLALDAARMGAWRLDLKTGHLDCTPLCKADFGLPADADLTYDRSLEIIHPEDRAAVRSEVERALAEGDIYRAEYRVVWDDGSPHWILASGRANYDESGEPYQMVGVTLDITESKLAEEEREKLLRNERAARAEAEEASRLKDEFLATLSHELRTPLTAVLGWSHLLLGGQLDEQTTTSALETIERNARSQNRLIEDLLDVSRIVTGKLRLDVRPVDLASCIEAAIEGVRPAAEAKDIDLQKVMGAKAGCVSGDQARLQQVIWNLLSNAIKFTPRGGRVRVCLERVASHIEISVSDTGEGIRPEFLPYVFDRFRQADGTTTRQHGGLGLGLAIVRQLTELHGGTVEVESAGEGLGATFTVRLPLLPLYRRQPLQEHASPRARGNHHPVEYTDSLNGLRVLVVDDEVDTLELIKVSLGQSGAEVTAARSAGEALDLLEQVMPDVILSDIGMPGEDGFDFIRKVRELPPERGGQIPAVALTAYARAEDRQRVLRSGYQKHMVKPVELAELLATMLNVAGRV